MFSGNVNPQVNTIVGGNTRGLHLSLKDEYASLKRELEHDKNGSSVIKGAWDLQPFSGQVPDTREGHSMVTIGNNIYMYGG